jgi:hypothetical protein
MYSARVEAMSALYLPSNAQSLQTVDIVLLRESKSDVDITT